MCFYYVPIGSKSSYPVQTFLLGAFLLGPKIPIGHVPIGLTDEFIGLKNSSESAQFWFLLGTFLLSIGYWAHPVYDRTNSASKFFIDSRSLQDTFFMNLHKFPSKTFFVLSGCITFENILSNSAQKPLGSSKLNAELGKKRPGIGFFA